MLVSGADDRTVRFWDLQSRTLIRTCGKTAGSDSHTSTMTGEGHDAAVNSVAFSTDGTLVHLPTSIHQIYLLRILKILQCRIFSVYKYYNTKYIYVNIQIPLLGRFRC